jgi:uncharacterized protein YndB with AHSA1/START domain
MIDVNHQISAVSRQIGTRTLEAGEAHTMTVTRVYDTGLEDLWDAVTNQERIPRWFLPVSGDLSVGGRFQIEGNAAGTVERCDPPKGFAATWEYGDEVSWIEVELVPESAARTLFRLEHIAHVDDERWAEYGPGAVGVGWDMALMGLEGHIASGEAFDKAEVEAWIGSDEGVRMMTSSSEAWRDASIAGGTDPDEARAAAERTTAFYTGAPPAS